MNRLQRKIVLTWMFSLLTICGFSGSGATYYVATTGSDSNTGGANDPFRWPQKGVDMARAGDKVIVRQGIYNCRVLFSSYSGSIDPVTFVPSYITMEGEPGAIINGGYNVTGNWTRDYSFTGGSVYKKVMSAPFGTTVRPQNLFYNDKMILHISDDNMATGGSGWTRLNDPQSSTNWVNIGALHGSTTVGATVTTYLRFADNRDPNQGTIYVSPHRNYSFTPTITISGQDYIKIKGFSLPNSSVSVLLSNGASNNVIERNDIYGATDGVYVLGSDTATDENLCHNNHIRYNNITLNFFIDLIYTNITNKDTWVWDQFKHFSDNDREGVLLYSAGHGNKVYGNNIYKHWGGIQDAATSTGALANKDYCKQLDVCAYPRKLDNLHKCKELLI